MGCPRWDLTSSPMRHLEERGMVRASSASKGRAVAPWGCSRTNCIQTAMRSGCPFGTRTKCSRPTRVPRSTRDRCAAMPGWRCLSETVGALPRVGMHTLQGGGANVGAGTGGILEYQQGSSAKAAPKPNPAPIAVLLRSVMSGGGPSPWRPHGKGLVHSGSVYWRG